VAQISVKIKVSNGRLQLVFSCPIAKKRVYFSPGYRDDVEGNQYAKILAAKIEGDILTNHYIGLSKYMLSPVTAEVPPEPQPASQDIDIIDLWQKYLDDIRPTRSQTTMGRQFRDYSRQLERCPFGINQPTRIRAWAIQTLTPGSARRLMMALNAFGKWGVTNGHIGVNPFEGLSVKKPKNAGDVEPNPLTAEERDAVLSAIANNPNWCYYSRFFTFLFYTGCRPSEAVALEWSHVAKDKNTLTFKQSATPDEQGRVRIKAGLKTQRKRTIKLSEKVRECLGDQAEGLVFPALRGGIIDVGNISQRLWKPALAAAGVEHRNMYQTRHTFATLALRAGVGAQDVAALIGNSPEVVYKHYAGVTSELRLPDI
jgi:integrase